MPGTDRVPFAADPVLHYNLARPVAMKIDLDRLGIVDRVCAVVASRLDDFQCQPGVIHLSVKVFGTAEQAFPCRAGNDRLKRARTGPR